MMPLTGSRSLQALLTISLAMIASACASPEPEDDLAEGMGAMAQGGTDLRSLEPGAFDGSQFVITFWRTGDRLNARVCDVSCLDEPGSEVKIDANGGGKLSHQGVQLDLSMRGAAVRVKGTVTRSTGRREPFTIDETVERRPLSAWEGTYRSVVGLPELQIQKADASGATVVLNGRTQRARWLSAGIDLELLPMTHTYLGSGRGTSTRRLMIDSLSEALEYEKKD